MYFDGMGVFEVQGRVRGPQKHTHRIPQLRLHIWALRLYECCTRTLAKNPLC